VVWALLSPPCHLTQALTRLGAQHPYYSVLASRGEVTLHQVACDCTLLYITGLLWVTQGARADEDSYLQRA